MTQSFFVSTVLRTFTGVILASILGFAPLVQADLQDRMDEIFNVMTNGTPGGAYANQTRGALAGGSFNLRATTMSPPLISFAPPAINSGCNGIDIFGGSFSFINSAQFEALLRNIASNAAGYAFSLAIESLCPTCAATMHKLSDKIQDLTSSMTNSCELATKLVNITGLDEYHDEKMHHADTALVNLGWVDDWLDAHEGTGDLPLDDKLNAVGAAVGFEGNFIWDAMLKSNIGNNFRGGDVSLRNIVMSLTGTYVGTCATDLTGNCTADFTYEYYVPTITFDYFFEGSNSDEAPRDIYTCANAACTVLQPVPTPIKGFNQLTREMLLGDGVDVGIVAKSRLKGAPALTAEQLAFIEMVDVPIWKMLNELSRDPGVGRTMAEATAPLIGLQITMTMLDDLVLAAETAINGQGDSSEIGMMYRNYDAMKEAIKKRYDEVTASSPDYAELFALYKTLKELSPNHTDEQVATMKSSNQAPAKD